MGVVVSRPQSTHTDRRPMKKGESSEHPVSHVGKAWSADLEIEHFSHDPLEN
jgi:hypothetical protein